MMRTLIPLALILAFLCLISGCGSTGGGVAYFDNVLISADSSVSTLMSDLCDWKIGEEQSNQIDLGAIDPTKVYIDSNRNVLYPENIFKDPNGDLIDISGNIIDKNNIVIILPTVKKKCVRLQKPDSVTVKINSQVLDEESLEMPSDIRIEEVIIEYIPLSREVPYLSTKKISLGQFISPDESVDIDILILDTDQKDLFWPAFYKFCLYDEIDAVTYKVRLTFTGVDVLTDNYETFSTSFNLMVNDYFDDEEMSCLEECI